MSVISDIIEFVKNEEFIFIQPHNYPDHDAVASAYGLQYLLSTFDIKSYIIYEGDIQRDSLKSMIEEFNIIIKHSAEYELKQEIMIINIDGCKGNKNITDLVGDEIAVIDHHEVSSPDDVRFIDIRPDYGACSTIVFDYFTEFGIEISQEVATVLMIGINMDTALLTRGVSAADINAYANLYNISDIHLQNKILRNFIQTRDLSFYKFAIDNFKEIDEIGFCYFPDGCNQNLLGILGDFFLALEEIDFVILCAKNDDQINFSIRNEKEQWNAAMIIQDVLKGIGFGGGHMDMAGGIIKNVSLFNKEEILNKFVTELKKYG